MSLSIKVMINKIGRRVSSALAPPRSQFYLQISPSKHLPFYDTEPPLPKKK